MGRPKGGYRTADGKRVPGTTTVLGRWKESGGLIRWAWQCGTEGIDLDDARDQAAGADTLAHEMIDEHIHGNYSGEAFRLAREQGASADLLKQASGAYNNFKRWADGVGMVVTHTEQPLVSEELRFGGTFDALVQVGHTPGVERFYDGPPKGVINALLDFKTGKGTRMYVDTLYQLGAYRILARECLGIECQEALVLKLSREQAGFAHYSYGAEVIERGETMFRTMLNMYSADKEMKKVVS